MFKEGVGGCVQGAVMERDIVNKGKLVNVCSVLVRKGMSCVSGEFVNVYSVMVRKLIF